MKTVDIYFKWVNSKHLETEEVAGVFSFEEVLGTTRLHIRSSDADDLRYYKTIDMKKAQKFPNMTPQGAEIYTKEIVTHWRGYPTCHWHLEGEVKHDIDSGELVAWRSPSSEW
jgi:hypothetical protein